MIIIMIGRPPPLKEVFVLLCNGALLMIIGGHGEK